MAVNTRILFTDLDGTLLNDNKEISEGNRAAVEEALAAGHKIVVSTGRALASGLQIAERVGLTGEGCYVIAFNGGQIYDPYHKKTIHGVTFPRDTAVEIFEKHGVYTKAEMESRAEVMYETYSKTINIEALTMIDMAKKQIVPATIKYQTSLAESVNAIKAASSAVDTSVQEALMADISTNLKDMYAALAHLEEVAGKAEAMEEGAEQGHYYHDVVFTAMDELRKPADKLEMLVAKSAWPFPSYGDLIFEV